MDVDETTDGVVVEVNPTATIAAVVTGMKDSEGPASKVGVATTVL